MRVAVCVAVAVACHCLANAAMAIPRRPAVKWQTHIDAQCLGPALQALAKEHRFQIVYVTEEVDNVRTDGAIGELSSDDALTKLLEGTGRGFRHLDEKTVTVFPVAGNRAATSGPESTGTPAANSSCDAATGARKSAGQKGRTTSADAWSAAAAEPPQPGGGGTGPFSAQVAGAQLAREDEATLGEVIVTARRREENLQQVPIAISVLSGAALEKRGIDDLLALSAVVPNVQIKQNQSGANFSNIRVRGIPGVAVYVDGIAYTNIAGQLLDVVDVARIEVLEGPQGTLFGKNAIGGALQYITVAPSDRFNANSKLTFGSFGRIDATGSINIPWSQTLFTKITGASLNRDGYVRNVLSGEYEGAARTKIGRFDVLFRPGDRFSARLNFNYTGKDTNQPPFVNMANNRVCAGDPVPAEYTGKIPGPLCVLNAIGLPVDQTLNFGAQGKWQVASDTNGPFGFDFTSRGTAAELNWNPAEKFSVRSLTGYRDLAWVQLSDNDGTPYVLVSNTNRGVSREFTQELQAAFRSGAFTGTSGFYYYKNVTTRASISWNYSDLLTPPLAAESAALGGRTPGLNQGEFKNDIHGWAAFSEWTARVNDFISLTAGGRYTFESNTTLVFPPPAVSLKCCELLHTLDPAGPALYPPRIATFTQFTPRMSLQYDMTPNSMAYATYSKGFNAGGFNTAGNAPFPFEPEILTNYELGVKSDLFDRHLRLNATAFYGVYDKVQVVVLLPVGQTVVQATENAGAGKIKGLEFQSTWLATDHLLFDLAGGWLDARYTDTGGAPGLTLNTRFPFAPEYNSNAGMQYQWSLDRDRITLRGDYTWIDHSETNIDPRFSVPIAAYGLLNARLAYQRAGADWNLALSVTNLTNRFYLVHGLNITQEGWALGGAGRPREWALVLSAHF
jgi:iron complex outermembrane receptor protein